MSEPLICPLCNEQMGRNHVCKPPPQQQQQGAQNILKNVVGFIKEMQKYLPHLDKRVQNLESKAEFGASVVQQYDNRLRKLEKRLSRLLKKDGHPADRWGDDQFQRETPGSDSKQKRPSASDYLLGG